MKDFRFYKKYDFFLFVVIFAGLAIGGLVPTFAQTSQSQPTKLLKTTSQPVSQPANPPKSTSQPVRPTSKPTSQPAKPPKATSQPAASQPSKTTKSTSKPASQPAEKPLEPALPHINYIFPAGGQRGKTVEITVNGLELDGADKVRISGEGVKGEVTQVVDAKNLKISVQVAPQAQPGVRDLRIITPGGISNRFRFFVGELPEIVEAEPNSEVGKAQRLAALPVIVNGQILSADKDIFRFSAKAGQTLVCEASARAVLPYIADAVPGWLQPVLTLSDADGKELAYADGFLHRQDPLLIYKIERDGEYLLEIRDSIYRGREDLIYRLRIGAVPCLTHIYPLGGKRGTTAQVELFGANLAQPSLSLKLPDTSPALLMVDATRGGSTSKALPFEVGEGEETSETEPNDVQQQANRISPSMTVNGRIQKPGDQDFLVFKAEAKQQLVIEVRARRLDSPLDSIITLYDAKGQQIAQNDDTTDENLGLVTHQADSRLTYTFTSTGDYFLKIGDTQGKGGSEYAYRLSIFPPKQDFLLRVSCDSPRLSPGDTTILAVDAVRKDGYEGEILLHLKGLPPGFVERGAVIPSKTNETRLSMTAPPEAPLGLQFPALVGVGRIDGQEVVHEALPIEAVMQAFSSMHRLPLQEFPLAIVSPGLFTLSVNLPPTGKAVVPQNGEVRLLVKAMRGKDAKGPINLAAVVPLPKGVFVRGATIPPDKNEIEITITAGKQTPVGTESFFVVTGTLRLGKQSLTHWLPIIPITVGVPASQPASTSQPTTTSKPSVTTQPKTFPAGTTSKPSVGTQPAKK